MERVIVYSTPSCAYCVKAKELLTKKGILFQEVTATREIILDVSGQLKVPVIKLDRNIIIGYDKLLELLS